MSLKYRPAEPQSTSHFRTQSSAVGYLVKQLLTITTQLPTTFSSSLESNSLENNPHRSSNISNITLAMACFSDLPFELQTDIWTLVFPSHGGVHWVEFEGFPNTLHIVKKTLDFTRDLFDDKEPDTGENRTKRYDNLDYKSTAMVWKTAAYFSNIYMLLYPRFTEIPRGYRKICSRRMYWMRLPRRVVAGSSRPILKLQTCSRLARLHA